MSIRCVCYLHFFMYSYILSKESMLRAWRHEPPPDTDTGGDV